MKVIETKLSGVVIIEPKVHSDERGFFVESYNQLLFGKYNINHTFIQDNHSLSVEKGVIRGLHYQLKPKAQTKLVRVLVGEIYDVVVDIRPSSETYGQWISVLLSGENKRQLLVPTGFAHGFCTTVINTEVLYKVDEYYSPVHDRGILWNDPSLGIDWPISNPILSDKDHKQPLLKDAEINFE
ncbi:dTDP-4-dehydrorhamnose 3,5-epimerase [Paenibacillus psychroresistens]|uniref:dTDP-4-dehydrorhamnose 3,5-epimerase n=1 Tax=Paenibacillus psychroresistens TaxID=1778678 RepID=A0A6B8RQ22_9BACL|nr:dTDP-4-dehydrorhamnose 3,5-epimerase [Paenibacillus psychroresistens]QGQ98471.1 dTDP-4-dehydrorhamnose 3,5-epimerase [Paenibacillus psychroresistens]